MKELHGEYDHFGICIFCDLPAKLCECTEDECVEITDSFSNINELGQGYNPYD